MAEREELSATRARQARPGRPVLYVLVAALVLCGLFVIGMLAFPSASTTPPSIGVLPNGQTAAVQKQVPPSNATQATPGATNSAK